MTEATPITPTEPTPVTPVESGPVAESSSYDDALGSAYDRLMSEGVSDDVPEKVQQDATGRDEKGRFVSKTPVEASPSEGEAAPQGEDNSGLKPVQGLPANWTPDMADVWAAIPEAQRERLGKWSQGLHAKMSDMGRKVSAYADVQAVMDDMVQTYADRFSGPDAMKPTDAIKFLYSVQKDMDQRPVETILEIASRYNAVPALAKALGVGGDGSAQVQALQGTIQQLEQRIAALVSPNTINEHISRAMSERELGSAVERFKSEKPFFAEVESDLPYFIDIARDKAPEASPLDVLASAYDMAVYANPAVREKAMAAQKAAAVPNLKAAAAHKAASINVKSTAGAKMKPRSEDEAMGEVWDKLMAS